MESISQKLNQLPQAVKDQLSSPELLDALMALETRVGARLTLPLVKIVLGELADDAIVNYLTTVSQLSPDNASGVAHELMALLAKFDIGIKAPIREIKATVPSVASAQEGAKEKGITFSSADEAEAKMYPVPERSNQVDYEVLIDQVVLGFGWNEADAVMTKRLRNVVLARLKGVRDDMEATEVLTKNKKVGGLEFTAEQGSALLKIINNQLNQSSVAPLPTGQRISFPTKRPFALREISNLEVKKQQADGVVERQSQIQPQKNTNTAFNPLPPPPKLGGEQTGDGQVQLDTFSKPAQPLRESADKIFEVQNTTPATILAPAKNVPSTPPAMTAPTIEEEDGLPVLRMPGEFMPDRPTPAVASAPAPARPESVAPVAVAPQDEVVSIRHDALASTVVDGNPFKSPRPAGPARPLPYRQNTVPPKSSGLVSRKPSVDGVKFVRQLSGPVEELEQMTLIEFRRLGATPAEAATKIKAMIELLEHESYTKKLDGINAWGKNEISQFYRLLGQTSMKEAKSIEQIITNRLESNKPTLTMEEFSAVMELNQELRY